MTAKLRVLIIEDNLNDAELAVVEIERAGYCCEWMRIETRQELLTRLESPDCDLILSDYSLPSFDGLTALRLVLARELDIPFILISGTVGEEMAIESLKAGATDYVMKNHLTRLGPVVTRALAEKEEQRQRKRAEEALRFTQFSIDHAADAVFWIGSDARFLYVNDAACRSLVYSRDELLSMTLHDIDSYFSAEVWPIRWETTRQGGSFTFESRHRTKEGNIFPVEITSNYLEFKGRGYICAFARDITERKQAEAAQIERAHLAALQADIGVALNKSESLQRILQFCAEALERHLKSALVRIWTLNEAANVLEIQAKAGSYAALDDSRIPVGKFRAGLIAESREPQLTNNVINDANLADPEWEQGEGIVGFAGYPLVVEDRLVGVAELFSRQPLEEGTLGALASVADVIAQCVERKRAEDALRAAEARYRDLFENANDIIYTHDLDGNFTSVNKLGERLLGYNANEIVGMNIADITAPEYLVESLSTRNTAAVESTAHELEITCKDGRRLPVEVSTRLIYEGTQPVGVQGIARDISERKHAELEHRRLEEELLQAQKMESVGRLAGGIAHDFNNLLTSILGNAQLTLRRLSTGDPSYSNLVEMEKAATRAGALTRQLLAFGRRQTLDRKIVDLNETIADFTQMLQRIIGEDVEVQLQLAQNLPTVFADPAQIEQVIMNLAVNARDAMPAGGRIYIKTENVFLDEAYCRDHLWVKPGPYAQISVSDTGLGMDLDTQQRIFEPFFTTKEIGKGTGLGLAVVYGIIKQHDGVVHVYSEPGHGTTFRIYLPAEEQAERIRKGQATEALTPLRGGSETILVAEDEEALRKLTGDVLARLGYSLLVARDGQEAFELYESNRQRVDLVVLDLVMPKMGGREVYERIRALGGRVPVIFTTGYSAELVDGQFFKEAATGVIRKPYSVDHLGRKVRETLDARAEVRHKKA